MAAVESTAVKQEHNTSSAVKQEHNTSSAAPAVLLAPALVHVKRSAKHKTITQGCDVWLGPRTKFNNVQLPQSTWANPFPDTDTSVKDGRYEAYLRTLLLHHTAGRGHTVASLDSLNGQVLGCGCKHAAPEMPTTDSLLAAMHGGTDAVAAMPKSELAWWSPPASDPASDHARRAKEYGCHGEVVLQLWYERLKGRSTTDTLIRPMERKRVIETLTLPQEAEEERKHKSESDASTTTAATNDGSKLTARTKKRKGALDSSSSLPSEKKQRRKRVPQVRNQTTDPTGLMHEGKLWPWPSLEEGVKLEGSLLSPATPPLGTTVRYEDTVYLDEAGRGPLAGPMTIGAVVLLRGFDIMGLHDSKLLTEHERETAFAALMATPYMFGTVVEVSAADIDADRIGRAWRKGMLQALRAVIASRPPGSIKYAVIDGDATVSLDGVQVECCEKGDRKFVGIAAAATLAKVTRDRQMVQLAQRPEYAPFKTVFENSKAYGSDVHMRLIKSGQYTDVHRRSFNPLESCLQTRPGYPRAPTCRVQPNLD